MKNYFTIEEICASDTAKRFKIDNTPDAITKSHIVELITFLNPLREAWGSPIRINSGYRCSLLNKKVGGSSTSSHMLGYAADLYPKNGKFTEFKTFIINYLKDKKFDQCIIEKSGSSQWIHFGLYNKIRLQRKQIFNIIK